MAQPQKLGRAIYLKLPDKCSGTRRAETLKLKRGRTCYTSYLDGIRSLLSALSKCYLVVIVLPPQKLSTARSKIYVEIASRHIRGVFLVQRPPQKPDSILLSEMLRQAL